MWVIFGTKDASVRVPNGASVTRRCESCGETTTFYEKTRTSTFRLYFIDVYDYKKNRVMECGACGAHYATDELGARDEEPPPSIEQRIEKGGKKIEGFAEKVGDAVTGLAAKIVNRPGPPPKRRVDVDVEPRASRDADDDGKDVEHDLSHDDFADDMEMKFRKLEREEELRKRGGV
ncbi:MAG TPA: hypothetical protein VGM56_29265 [Byssovorax sp.]